LKIFIELPAEMLQPLKQNEKHDLKGHGYLRMRQFIIFNRDKTKIICLSSEKQTYCYDNTEKQSGQCKITSS